jgi:PAS domain S-box-containing protein
MVVAQQDPAGEAEELNGTLFHLAAESVTDFAIFLLDRDGLITSWNPGGEVIFGYEPSEIVGQPVSRIFTAEDQAAGIPEQELGRAADQGRSDDVRWHERKDGTRFWAVGVVTALRDAKGTLQGFVKILRDRTEQKVIEDSLRGRAEALLVADDRKNLFIATLAHELRNPLAPITYAAHILRRRVGEIVAAREPLDIIEQQARLLNRLVDDLLDVVRVKTGKVTINRQVVQLGTIIQGAVEAVRPLIEARKHHLSVSQPQEPVWLNADPQRLQQVFVNLLTNAAKYTEEGGSIWVSTAVEDSDAVVRVRDTCVGIPPDRLEQIFGFFTQVDNDLHLAKGGLGIGLSLVKNLVELHGGAVIARSDGPRKGSEFTVRLPLHTSYVPETVPSAQ